MYSSQNVRCSCPSSQGKQAAHTGSGPLTADGLGKRSCASVFEVVFELNGYRSRFDSLYSMEVENGFCDDDFPRGLTYIVGRFTGRCTDCMIIGPWLFVSVGMVCAHVFEQTHFHQWQRVSPVHMANTRTVQNDQRMHSAIHLEKEHVGISTR